MVRRSDPPQRPNVAAPIPMAAPPTAGIRSGGPGLRRPELRGNSLWCPRNSRKSAREESSFETGIDEPGCLVHTTFSVTLFVAHQVTVMLHIARRRLFALVFACHAAVTLCGPCLHALPGSSHELRATSNSQHTDDSGQSRRDGADNCLICQFVAQGQLLAEVFTATSFDQMNELVPPVAALSHSVSVPLPSFPRAPPFANFTLS